MLIGIFLFSHLGAGLKPTIADDQIRVVADASVLHSIPVKHPETVVIKDGNRSMPGTLQIPSGKIEDYAAILLNEFGVNEVLPVEGRPTFSLTSYGKAMKGSLDRYFHGNLGNLYPSYSSRRQATAEVPFADKLGELLPKTLRYLLPALALAIAAGTASALIASFKPWLGKCFDSIHAILMALPDFVVVCLLQILCIFLAQSFDRPFYLIVEFNDRTPFLIPFATIALIPGALIYGTLRVAVRREWAEDYIVTARSKGLTRRLIILRHVLRNVADDLFAVLPKATGLAVAGMVMVEVLCQIFGLGGIVNSPRYNPGESLISVCLILGLLTFALNLFYAILKRLLHVDKREVQI